MIRGKTAEAVRMIRGKTAVGRRVFAGLLPELRGRAFMVAGIEDINLLERLRDRIGDLPDGGDWDEIKKEIAQDLTPFFVDPEAGGEEMGKQIAEADRRAELLVRTHGFQAYAATRYREQMENRDIQPFWQYKAFGDGRVRDTHRALDGLVFPAGHPFWDDHYPPWEWGCRCIVIGLSPEAVEEIRKEDEGKAPDQQRVIEGEFLKAVEERKSLPRGPNEVIDLRSPVDKAADAQGKNMAYRWNPGELKLDLDQIKQRYSPSVWAEFESFAKATDVGDGRSVWEWAQPERAPTSAQKEAMRKAALAWVKAQAAEEAKGKAKSVTMDEVREKFKKAGVANVELVQPAGKVRWGSKMSLKKAAAHAETILGHYTSLTERFPNMPKSMDTFLAVSGKRGRAHIDGPKPFLSTKTQEWTAQKWAPLEDWEKRNGRRWCAERKGTQVDDNFRHEYAHTLSTPEVVDSWTRIHLKLGVEWFGKNVSEYATTDRFESLAESFCICTRTDFVRGSLNAEVEEFIFKTMLRET